MLTQTVDQAFDATLNEREVGIEFSRTTTYSTCDIDDDYAEDIFVCYYVDSGDGVCETAVPYAQLSRADQVAVMDLVDAYMLDTDPPYVEYDEEYERAASRARGNDFEDTGGKDWT